MIIENSIPTSAEPKPAARVRVSLSRWVNERAPAWREILTAHDVARLTRRHYLLLRTLALIGAFPKQVRFRGRPIGWRRSDVLDWMARELSVADPLSEACRAGTRRSHCRSLRQIALPLEAVRRRPRERCRSGKESPKADQ